MSKTFCYLILAASQLDKEVTSHRLAPTGLLLIKLPIGQILQ
jgi:hypothetical protein